MSEETIKSVIKNYFAKEIEISKRQATKDFIANLDKVIDKSIDDFVRIVLQAVRQEDND